MGGSVGLRNHSRGLGCRLAYDVSQTSSGTAHSRVVTRYNSALTGQALGRCRRMRSLYCYLGGNFAEGEDDGRGLRLGQGGMRVCPTFTHLVTQPVEGLAL